MCKKLTFFCCLGLLLSALPIVTITAQVTTADYLRADTFLKCSNKMYSSAVIPAWLDSSHYFWYKNHERGGDFYYLVNAKTGKKQRGTDKKQLAAFLTGKQKPLAEILLKEEDEKNANYRRNGEEAKPVVSPDAKWEAYIRDNNVYIRPAGDEKDKKKEEIALTTDGTTNLFYSSYMIWSPDSRKLATVKVRGVQERRIPLIESSPESQRQPILQWRDYAKPGDVIEVCLPALFDIESRKQILLNVEPYANQFTLYLTGGRKDSRAVTFEFNQRGHQRYIVGEVNATGGTIRRLADEQANTWIPY